MFQLCTIVLSGIHCNETTRVQSLITRTDESPHNYKLPHWERKQLLNVAPLLPERAREGGRGERGGGATPHKVTQDTSRVDVSEDP